MGSKPKIPAAPPPPAQAPTPVDPDVLEGRKRERKRLTSAGGRRSTILTGALGAGSPTLGRPTLLGGGGGYTGA